MCNTKIIYAAIHRIITHAIVYYLKISPLILYLKIYEIENTRFKFRLLIHLN